MPQIQIEVSATSTRERVQTRGSSPTLELRAHLYTIPSTSQVCGVQWLDSRLFNIFIYTSILLSPWESLGTTQYTNESTSTKPIGIKASTNLERGKRNSPAQNRTHEYFKSRQVQSSNKNPKVGAEDQHLLTVVNWGLTTRHEMTSNRLCHGGCRLIDRTPLAW